jgi:hypothetical protein
LTRFGVNKNVVSERIAAFFSGLSPRLSSPLFRERPRFDSEALGGGLCLTTLRRSPRIQPDR